MIDRNSLLWQYLSAHQQELVADGEKLFEAAGKQDLKLYDYSYAVFPYAKAYEGFLKKIFFDLGFIDEQTYRGEHFRIGRALNPSLEPALRFESIYDKVVGYCGGKELADALWHVWKKGRNLTFHYFPHNYHKLSLSQAEEVRHEIVRVMEKAIGECKIPQRAPDSFGKA